MAGDGRFTAAHAPIGRLHLDVDAYDHLTAKIAELDTWSPYIIGRHSAALDTSPAQHHIQRRLLRRNLTFCSRGALKRQAQAARIHGCGTWGLKASTYLDRPKYVIATDADGEVARSRLDNAPDPVRRAEEVR